MIGLDTTVLVRVLVDDPDNPSQVAAARKRVHGAREIYIPQIVQAECAWVLEKAYRFEKPAVFTALSHLAGNAVFILQKRISFLTALREFQSSNAGFADCLILADSREENCELLTFDKKLARLPGAKLAKPVTSGH